LNEEIPDVTVKDNSMSFEEATSTVKSKKFYNLSIRRMKSGKKFWPFDSDEKNKDEIKKSSRKKEDTKNAFPKVGRNDPCPCGSNKKYKQCHGTLD